jgi:hypothetical protein
VTDPSAAATSDEQKVRSAEGRAAAALRQELEAERDARKAIEARLEAIEAAKLADASPEEQAAHADRTLAKKIADADNKSRRADMKILIADETDGPTKKWLQLSLEKNLFRSDLDISIYRASHVDEAAAAVAAAAAAATTTATATTTRSGGPSGTPVTDASKAQQIEAARAAGGKDREKRGDNVLGLLLGGRK